MRVLCRICCVDCRISFQKKLGCFVKGLACLRLVFETMLVVRCKSFGLLLKSFVSFSERLLVDNVYGASPILSISHYFRNNFTQC